MGRRELDEQRHGAERPGPARWPLWSGPIGLGIALIVTLLLGAVVSLAAWVAGADVSPDVPAVVIAGTLVQDLMLIATAVVFASWYGAVRPKDLGLRPTALKRALGWTLAALVVFYAISGVYGALVHPKGDQNVVESLGAERSTGYLVATALMVIIVAPVAEEVFFRGFFYRSLRNRFPPLGAAAIVGLVFGAIHYTDADTLLLVPVLALLGVLFCLLYERTGSLYPAIAMHAVNNALALATNTNAGGAVAISVGFGVLAVAGCLAAPAVQLGRVDARGAV